MSSSQNDNIDYKKLSVAKQGWIGESIEFNTNYQGNTIIVHHNLGYVPIALVYHDAAGGDRDPSEVTPEEFTGKQVPYFTFQNGFGTVPNIYISYDYQITTMDLVINIQHWTTVGDPAGSTHFFKYYLFSQTALQGEVNTDFEVF